MQRWEDVPNLNVDAFRDYLDCQLRLRKPVGGMLSERFKRTRAEMCAQTGPPEHQAKLLAWHSNNDYRKFVPLDSEQLAAKDRIDDEGDKGKGGKYERMMEAMNRG